MMMMMTDLPVEQRDSIAHHMQRQMVGSSGLPVGVQVVAKPYRDEVALHISKYHPV